MELKGGGNSNRADAPGAARANVNSVWLMAFFDEDMWQTLLWRTGAV